MTAAIVRRHPPAPRRERGFILATGMLFLVVLTLLGLTLFRSSGLMERMSANTRDKQRSFESAEAALVYAEWWLSTGHGGSGVPCAGVQNANVITNITVCSNPLANFTDFTTTQWPIRFEYTPPNMSISASGGAVGAGGDVNYQAVPGFYIEYLGLSSSGKARLYQVTAYGYGGNADTGTVVRSVYQVTGVSVCNLEALSC